MKDRPTGPFLERPRDGEGMNLNSIVRRLTARAELDPRLNMSPDHAKYLIRLLAPMVAEIVREDIAEARRAWEKRETQR